MKKMVVIAGVMLVVVAAALLWCCSISAQPDDEKTPEKSGGAVLEESGGQELDYQCTEALYIVVSPDRKFIAGFSKRTEQWQKEDISPGEDEAIDINVASQVGAVQVGNKLYGFSATAGVWHVVELKAGEVADIEISANMITAKVGTRLYAFGSEGARWDFIDVPPKK
ncbi:MAG: hypothetical protein RDV41_13185 [Planctomycetota bacterium]|nr:hypothetical protein [Planctomycetota bacterium]